VITIATAMLAEATGSDTVGNGRRFANGMMGAAGFRRRDAI
jgi:hypothetical protein